MDLLTEERTGKEIQQSVSDAETREVIAETKKGSIDEDEIVTAKILQGLSETQDQNEETNQTRTKYLKLQSTQDCGSQDHKPPFKKRRFLELQTNGSSFKNRKQTLVSFSSLQIELKRKCSRDEEIHSNKFGPMTLFPLVLSNKGSTCEFIDSQDIMLPVLSYSSHDMGEEDVNDVLSYIDQAPSQISPRFHTLLSKGLVYKPYVLSSDMKEKKQEAFTQVNTISNVIRQTKLPNQIQKICRMDYCNSPAAKRSPYCSSHRGVRKCEHKNSDNIQCSKYAQGHTRFCIAHGGGRRCQHPGCKKAARDKQFCAGHGGGKRCSVPGCERLALVSTRRGSAIDILKCTAHGGGKRCHIQGCTKSAQSGTDYCVRHGGGKRCIVLGCEKVARGKTLFCMSHYRRLGPCQNLNNSSISIGTGVNSGGNALFCRPVGTIPNKH